MSGKYGSASVTVSLEDAPGGTARAIQSFILTMSGMKITSVMEATHPLGDAWEATTPTGVKKGDPITLSGWWDTTPTTGSHAVMKDVDDGPQDDGRELILGFGDSKTCTMDVRLVSYAVVANNGNLTKFEAVLQPTGTITWA